jgi:tungstate transport system ATP-binding protein
MKNLTKAYNGRKVLDITDLQIQRGEVLGLVGPSGAGKSTLLRLLNFLEPPTSGAITFQGQTLENGLEMPLELRRLVTTVFQRPMLLNRTEYENVAFGLQLRGLRETKAHVLSALEQVGLANLARQRARTLSGGEAQRVVLARAMALKPAVLLLDEPTANLDPYNVGQIEEIVRQLNQQQGVTLVLVTHNVFQAHRLASRVGFMLDGRLVEITPTEQFFNQPADPRTAAFVRGEMVY